MSSHANEGTPAFIAPPLACDTHFHVFGAAGQYPYGGGLRYQPPHAPLEDYLALAQHLGVERFVFVQPSAYARDNRCMLDAMRTLTAQRGAACCRGIVDIDEDIPDAELRTLHAAGVRGVRINVSPVHAPTRGLADSMIPRIRKFEERFVALGLAPCWQLDFLPSSQGGPLRAVSKDKGGKPPPSFGTPLKRSAPQDEGGLFIVTGLNPWRRK